MENYLIKMYIFTISWSTSILSSQIISEIDKAILEKMNVYFHHISNRNEKLYSLFTVVVSVDVKMAFQGYFHLYFSVSPIFIF